jgi:Zn finger protein HypA/HybF involved in hydrogenase expression
MKNITFIEKANKIHNNFYSYEKANYINNKTKVTITCPKHGDFEQIPKSHLANMGCRKCADENTKIKISMGIEDFIDRVWDSGYKKFTLKLK